MARLDDDLAPVVYLPGADPDAVRPEDSARTEQETAGRALLARNVGITALARRGLSRRELERTLRDRDFDDETIAAEVDRLEREGLIDDQALAQHLVGTLQERKGYGRTAVAAELARRMLAPAAIEYAMELIDSGDELARARELAVKRAAQLRGYDHETAARRLSGYLSRRGYSGSAVRAAVEHALPRGRSDVRFG